MIYLIAILLAIPLLIGLTLALYILDYAVRSADGLHWLAKALLLPWLWIGLGLDILLNATVASIVFAELPKEWTFSERINRHEHESTGWRWLLATWVCKGFLRPVDNDHC